MTKKKVNDYKTIFPAICVPMNSDYSINEPELRKYVKWLADFDEIGGLVCNGHTGEITGLTREERKKVVEIVADEVGDQVLIISGINCENTLETIEHVKDAKQAGADGILLMPPHMWLRFGMHPDAPLEYVRRVAEATDLGIIIHLYPSTTKAFYPVETLVEMSKIPTVKSVKMGTRNQPLYERDIRILREKAPHLSLITCHDESLLSSMFPGVDGALIGFAGCIPELITEAWKAMKDEDLKLVREYDSQIAPVAEAIYGIGQPSGEAHARMKEALYQRGIFSSPIMREPVLPLAQDEKDKVTAGLAKGGVQKVKL
jgi:4-hydroxy-tetrahydrodipicolinate synthase